MTDRHGGTWHIGREVPQRLDRVSVRGTARRRSRLPRPAVFKARRTVVVDARNLPDSGLLRVAVLGDSLFPGRAAAKSSDQPEFVPSALSGPTVRREIQDGSVLEQRVQAASGQALAAVSPFVQEEPANRGPAVDAVGTEDRFGIAGEERSRLAPQAEL